jgi:hypothetical protein
MFETEQAGPVMLEILRFYHLDCQQEKTVEGTESGRRED